ncbi:MAG TPA: hypothetical protein VKP30_00075 [Polyangiaceae bacterium]|nr:hypothetical protein [Polyangiaceae bacterium]
MQWQVDNDGTGGMELWGTFCAPIGGSVSIVSEYFGGHVVLFVARSLAIVPEAVHLLPAVALGQAMIL